MMETDCFKYKVFDQKEVYVGFLMVGIEIKLGDEVSKSNGKITEFSGIVETIEESSDSEYEANLYLKPIPN